MGEFLWVRACFFTQSLGEGLFLHMQGRLEMLHVERG